MKSPALAILAATALGACGAEPEAAPARSDTARPRASGPAPVLPAATQLGRCADPRYRESAAAFERGDFERAAALQRTLPDGLDARLLAARIAAANGDEIAAIATLEAARASYPAQGRVYATAAEIHAAAQRLTSAEEEIREGLGIAGATPDLDRARGVLALCRAGGAARGLEHLLAARRAEPELEFCARPLSQAHLLLGNAALARRDALEAQAHAKAALITLPDDREAQQLLADARAATGDFAGALALYEKLVADGADLRGSLSLLALRGATAALVEGDRATAVARYLRARELGVSDEELSFGLTVLEEEAHALLERGLDAYEGADLAAARSAFESAVKLDPRSLAAHNHLGVVLFKQSDYDGAARAWRTVLELARAQSLELPEPVHLNLARALHNAGRSAEVRPLLEAYLADAPDGAFAAETREMLARLADGSTRGQ